MRIKKHVDINELLKLSTLYLQEREDMHSWEQQLFFKVLQNAYDRINMAEVIDSKSEAK